VNEWIEKLSVKKDIRLEKFTSVAREILKLDSTYCEAFSALEEKAPRKNKRIQSRLNLLKGNYILDNGGHCPGWGPADLIFKEGLQLSYEIEDDILIAIFNQGLLKWYHNQSDYGSAGMHGLIAKEIQERIGIENFYYLAYARYDLGYILYHSREYKESINASMKAIYWPEQPGASQGDSLDDMYKMYAWNTIGLCYSKLAKYDSAFIAYDCALVLASRFKNEFWQGLLNGNKGDIYFETGQYDSAYILLYHDYEISKANGQFDNAANSLQRLAGIHVHQEQPALALKEAREAAQMLQRMPKADYEVNLLFTFAQIFKSLGNVDSLDHYMNRYVSLHDSLEKVAVDSRAGTVKMRLDNQAFVNEIRSLNKEKQRITLIRNFGIGIILLLAALAYVDFKRQNLKIQLQKREAIEGQRLAEIETASAQEQLKEFTLNIIDKSRLIENLEQQLLHKEVTAEQHQMIGDLRHQQILIDTDWDKFKTLFERVYPGFFISLRNKATDITVAELRMAALIKLQLTSKESAALIGVSLDSIHKSRQRLKQRLQLTPEGDLDHLILSL